MDIFINRRGGVPVRDQLVTQLELKILGGEIAQGQRLPSVRALARRLKVHHNTVSAAYQDLQAAGHVELRRGSGVFVRSGGPRALAEANGLDEMIRLALHAAFAKGFGGSEVRAAVERWLAAAPPDRVVVIDPSREMAEVITNEIRQGLGISAAGATFEDLARDPSLLSGALAVVLPYHEATVLQMAPGAALEVVHLEVSAPDRDAINALPAGSIVLVVSHAATVLPFASVFLRSLRGEDIHVEVRLLSAAREWRRLVAAADFVLADILACAAVRAARPRRLREVRMLSPSALERLREALTVVVPRGESRTRGHSRA
ncbi:MAG TPA: GntR family transcriptional regulator [Vicinamibacteria bacterium]|jgi:DNA-binding transcriptional regulator YhcF (GntR family)